MLILEIHKNLPTLIHLNHLHLTQYLDWLKDISEKIIKYTANYLLINFLKLFFFLFKRININLDFLFCLF